jgi:heme-degrading monooxygenase HmoA
VSSLRPRELMYVSMSHLRICPERASELIEAFSRRSGLVEGHPGFVDLQVWQSDRDPGEVVMVSRWRDRACFKAYMKSADHQISHQRIDAGLRAAIKLESLAHMHTFEVVAE